MYMYAAKFVDIVAGKKYFTKWYTFMYNIFFGLHVIDQYNCM